MATAASLAIRQEAAFNRIQAALKALAPNSKVDSPNALEIRHRDPAQEQTLRVEQIADALDGLVGQTAKGAAESSDKIASLEAELESAKAELDALKATGDPGPATGEQQPPATVETVEEKPLITTEVVEIVPDAGLVIDDSKPKGKGK